MDIEKIIKMIVDNGKIEDMHELSDILEDTMEDLKHYSEKTYKKYELDLYEMAYGCVLNREMAKDIVHNMKPFGENWPIEQTNKMQQDYGLNFKDEDFYVVVNSAYNDYNDIFKENIDLYIKFAIDFINDEDAIKDKVYIYYTTIPK